VLRDATVVPLDETVIFVVRPPMLTVLVEAPPTRPAEDPILLPADAPALVADPATLPATDATLPAV
jgi:hypothetical protein